MPLSAGFEIEITPQQMQQMAEQQFPIKKQTLFARIEITQPEITLPGEQRLALAMKVSAYYPNKTMSKGHAIVDGKLGYDEKKGEFRLIQPRLKTLDIQGVTKQHNKLLQELISQLVTQAVDSVVIYRLDEKRFRDRMTKRSLKKVVIRDGILYAEVDY